MSADEKVKIKLPNPSQSVKASGARDPFGLTVLFPAIPYPLPGAPSNEMTMFFKGFDSILAKYKDIDTDKEIEDARKKMSGALELKKEEGGSPYIMLSPISPEKGEEAVNGYVNIVDAASAAAILACIAGEAASLGQIDYTLTKIFDHPVLAAALEVAKRVHMATLIEGVYPAYRYKILKDFQPYLADADTYVRLYQRGVYSEDSLLSKLEYLGYDSDVAADIVASAWRAPDLNSAITLLRRGQITTDAFNKILRYMGILPEWHGHIAKLIADVPEPYRLADFAAKGLIGDDKLTSGFSWHGISADWARIWAESQLQYPTLSVAFDLLWRGVINDEIFKAWMRRQGYKEDVTAALLNLKEQIPPASDLITMVVREAFVPEWVTPAPDIFAKYMAMKGFSKEWADRYWTAHWVRMPLAQAYACYYRGYWNEDRLRAELKYHDYHPYLIDDMVKVAYGVPSIRELGYGYDVGVYTLEDIERYRRWAGLSPEDAKKAAQAMVAYRTEAERNAVRTELLYAYGRGKLTLEELEAKLKEIKTPPEAIPLWLERAQLYKDRITKEPAMPEQRIISSSEAISAFVKGLRDEQWLRQKLKDLNWTDDRIDLAVEKAKLEIEEAKPKPKEPTYRYLTQSQMRQLYQMGKIDFDFIYATFLEMGYKDEDALLLAELTTYVEEKPVEIKPFPTGVAEDLYYYLVFDEEDLWYNFTLQGYDEAQSWLMVLRTVLNQEYPTLKKLYGEGVINDEELQLELMRIGLTEDIAKALVQKTKFELGVQRISKEKDLTKSEIIKGVKSGVISYSQGIELLVDIGYSPEEADYLLKINKVVAAGDPESYLEMKRVTEAYKKARGEPSMEIPEEALAIEAQIRQVKKELEEARKHPEDEQRIADLALKLNDLEARLRTVLAKAVRR